jgi:5-methylcytosine-specific restriction endonuclease McrA
MKRNPKKTLINKCDKLWYRLLLKEECEVCGKRANQVHHFFPKGSYPNLRYNLKNGISICPGCHLKHHLSGDPTIHQTIIERRGKKWYNPLLLEAKKKTVTIKIKDLQEVLDKLSEV